MTSKLLAMIKKRIYQLVFLSFFCISYYDAKAQSYSVKSFDGNEAKIELSNKSRRTLTVSYLKDTVFLTEYIATTKVQVLNGRFLKITYDTRGGSGLDLNNTLIVSVSKSKINVSMLVTSYAKLVSADKNGLYTSKFNITGNDQSNYKLIVNVHDQQASKLHPENNYNKNEVVTLNYNPTYHIFYSANRNINQSFNINDPKTQQADKQQIKGLLPVIELGQNAYYYIKGDWYKSGYNYNLFEEYNR